MNNLEKRVTQYIKKTQPGLKWSKDQVIFEAFKETFLFHTLSLRFALIDLGKAVIKQLKAGG